LLLANRGYPSEKCISAIFAPERWRQKERGAGTEEEREDVGGWGRKEKERERTRGCERVRGRVKDRERASE